MAWRYFKSFMSDSCTHLSLPMLVSSSFWAIFRTVRWFNNNERAHVRVIAELPVAVRIRVCKNVGHLDSKYRIICNLCFLCYLFKRKFSWCILNLQYNFVKRNNGCGTQNWIVWLPYTHGLCSMCVPCPHKEDTFKIY